MTYPIGTAILTSAGAKRVKREDLAFCQVEFYGVSPKRVLKVCLDGDQFVEFLDIGDDVTDPLYWHDGALQESRP